MTQNGVVDHLFPHIDHNSDVKPLPFNKENRLNSNAAFKPALIADFPDENIAPAFIWAEGEALGLTSAAEITLSAVSCFPSAPSSKCAFNYPWSVGRRNVHSPLFLLNEGCQAAIFSPGLSSCQVMSN